MCRPQFAAPSRSAVVVKGCLVTLTILGESFEVFKVDLSWLLRENQTNSAGYMVHISF